MLLNLTAYGVLLALVIVKAAIGDWVTAALAAFLIVAMMRIGQLEQVVAVLTIRELRKAQARQQEGGGDE